MGDFKMFLRRKLKQTLACSPKRRKLTTNFWPPTGKKPNGKPQRPTKWTQLRKRIPKRFLRKLKQTLGCSQKRRIFWPLTRKKPKGKPQRPPKRKQLRKRISKRFLGRTLKQTLRCSPKRRRMLKLRCP